MNKIIFLIESKFCKRDYERFGIKEMEKSGFKVQIWDLSPILRPEYSKNYIPPDAISYTNCYIINDRMQFIVLFNNNKNSIVLPQMPLRKDTLFIFSYLTEHKIKYGYYDLGKYPVPIKPLLYKIYLLFLYPILFIKRIVNTIIDKIDFKIKTINIIPPNFIVIGGTSTDNNSESNKLGTTYYVKAHAFDYDIYLNCKNNHYTEMPTTKYAVYLDSYQQHPDGKYDKSRFPPESPCSAEDYYPPINKFLSEFERLFKLKIIVSAHPRSNYGKDNPFEGRDVIEGHSAELVSGADVVLLHGSTAINYAILYKKPIIFLTNKYFTPHNKLTINTFAKYFSKDPIRVNCRMPSKSVILENMYVNTDLYQAYTNKYIKEQGTPDTHIVHILCKFMKTIK